MTKPWDDWRRYVMANIESNWSWNDKRWVRRMSCWSYLAAAVELVPALVVCGAPSYNSVTGRVVPGQGCLGRRGHRGEHWNLYCGEVDTWR